MLFGQEFMPLEDLLFFGAASGGKLSELTASGNPCVFETDVARPLKRLALSLLPRQSGTGDPSPSNIRPLLPWGEVGTWTGGKNLFQTTAQSKTAQGVTFTVNNDGTVSVGGSATGYVDLILGEVPVPNTGKIRISGVGTARNIAWSTMRLIDENGDTVVDFYGTAYTYDFTINLDDYPTAKKIRLGIKRSNNGEVSGTVMPMVEIGDTTTAFVPFAPITPHPVDLTGITPPVYGCELDLTTGEVWGTVDEPVSVASIPFYMVASGVFASNAGAVNYDGSRRTEIACSAYKTVAFTYWNQLGNNQVMGIDNGGTIRIRDDRFSSYDDFKAYLTEEDVKIVLPLATPVLLSTLTPQQISAIVGVNTVWSDADNVDVTYLKKG